MLVYSSHVRLVLHDTLVRVWGSELMMPEHVICH